ncbi:hypothetical protein ACFY04_02620 [Streptomyces sp. NPDC001549]
MQDAIVGTTWGAIRLVATAAALGLVYVAVADRRRRRKTAQQVLS